MLEKISVDVLVVLIAGNSTGVLALAIQTYRMVKSHDRALFGDARNDYHDGLIEVVEENEKGVKSNRVEIETNRERIDEIGDPTDYAEADD